MNIVVLVKQVPDTWAERKLKDSDKTLDRASVDVVMNEIDEYAVEEALKIKEAFGGEVTILTMGPDRAVETIRKALSMGADKAVHLSDDALAGSDAVQTSYALAKVLDTLEYDLSSPAPRRPTRAWRSCRRCSPSGPASRSCPARARSPSRAATSGSSGRPRTATTSSRRPPPPSSPSSRRSTSRATPPSRGSWPRRRS